MRSDVRELTDSLHSPAATDAKPPSAGVGAPCRSFRRPRRRQPTAEEQQSAELSELIQIVESEGPQKGGRRPGTGEPGRPPGRPARRHIDLADVSDRGDGARSLQSYLSLEELGSPGSPAPSSASVRDTDAAPEDDLFSESGAGDKLEHREVIRCNCGIQEEDGLMIQCELCLSWQHGVCLGISSDSEVPCRYVCDTCRHPWRVRRTQRYVWDQEMFRDGAIMRLPFSGDEAPLEQARAVMRAACDLTANTLSLQSVIRSLRTKLAIASDLNHPKLYLWARPWSPPPNQENDQSELTTAAGDQSRPASAAGDQSRPASAAGDQSASLLAAALDSPALLAAVTSAAALMPAGLANHVTSSADNGPGHVTGPGAVQNGVPAVESAAPTEAAESAESDPLAALSSDQTALLTASLAAAGSTEEPPPALDGAPPMLGAAVSLVQAAPALDGVPPAMETSATLDAPAASEETPVALEEADDPLSGVLDAIVGLLPSQSDLEQLMDGAVPEPQPAPPAAPVGEARIDPATCQVNLLKHVTQMQMALLARMDAIEQHVEALEKVAELEPDSGAQRPGACRQTLHTVLRDIRLVERMGRLS